MCGIAGEVRFGVNPERDAIGRMTEVLIHRGPDDEGFLFDGPAALGHRRLSILDIEGGSQPMSRERCAIVFNGEAYEFEELRRTLQSRGHLFTTRSDTEVVLRAYLEWGDRFVERVHGMFALAIWDGRHQRLLLARDRLGKKPLYFALGRRGRWEKRPGRAGARLHLRERREAACGARRPIREWPLLASPVLAASGAQHAKATVAG